MPSAHRFLVNLRGTDQYGRYLDRVVKALIKSGVPLEPGDRNGLAEIAIIRLGESVGVKPVERIPPQGTNRHGKPKDETARQPGTT